MTFVIEGEKVQEEREINGRCASHASEKDLTRLSRILIRTLTAVRAAFRKVQNASLIRRVPLRPSSSENIVNIEDKKAHDERQSKSKMID